MPAGFMIRLGALVLDVIIVVIPLYILSLLITDGTAQEPYTRIILFLYFFLVPVFWDGYTIGKRICGIKIRKVKGRSKPGVFTMFRRIIVTGLVYMMTLGIAVIASALRVVGMNDHRSMHDQIAGTEVVFDDPYRGS